MPHWLVPKPATGKLFPVTGPGASCPPGPDIFYFGDYKRPPFVKDFLRIISGR
jgi:hypothetical protein